MLQYKTDRTRPDLVTFYDILPGNGAGLFLQPRNPHGVGRPRMWRLGTGHWTTGPDIWRQWKTSKVI